MTDDSITKAISIKGTYSAAGTDGLKVVASDRSVRLLGSSGTSICGYMSIDVTKWGAVKQLIDDAIAHYQALTVVEGEDNDENNL